MAKKQPNPRPRDADATKAAILRAAREHFAAHGYERATVRAIAAEASIDPALVIRYFGSKEELLNTAANFDLRLPDLTCLGAERVGAVLVEHFVARWEADDTFIALLRSAVTHPGAARRIQSVLRKQVAPAIAAVARDPERVELRAALVASQILGLALCRYVLRVPPLAGLSSPELIASVAPTLQRYAVGDLS